MRKTTATTKTPATVATLRTIENLEAKTGAIRTRLAAIAEVAGCERAHDALTILKTLDEVIEDLAADVEITLDNAN